MEDSYGRPLTSLRISINQDCNLDCFYCHQEGCLREDREMSSEEIGKLVETAAEFGMEKVKLTGGEPLIREDVVEIVERIPKPPVTDLSITTNGIGLDELADPLVEAGLDRANISLDTLDPDAYEEITGGGNLEKVLDGIEAAVDAGLFPVKLNTIVMEGVNEDQIDDLIDYSIESGTILQLIELEEVLPKNSETYERYHKELDSIEEEVRERASEVDTRWQMQARRKYSVDGGEVEIVNPMHNSEFCAHCTRLRMTSGGYLKPCLMRNDNLVDVLTPFREGDMELVRESFEKAVERREPFFKAD